VSAKLSHSPGRSAEDELSPFPFLSFFRAVPHDPNPPGSIASSILAAPS
jgi:hypothetical protein